MKTYELTYIIAPDITIEEAEAKSKEIENAIQSKEGVILKSDKPVAKTLSYQIKKFGSGFFAILEFQSEPEVMVQIKSDIEKDGKILRHLILVKNPARKLKERRQRIKPALVVENIAKEVQKDAEKVVEFVKEKIEKILEEKPASVKDSGEARPEKKTTTRKKAEKSKEKAEMEDIDKKLDEILSE